MRYRNPDQGREGGHRPPSNESIPEYDDDGLHGQDRRQYRGQESYEQQTRGGEGGRSGMWDHRHISPDHRQDDAYRNYADEHQGGSHSREDYGPRYGGPDYDRSYGGNRQYGSSDSNRQHGRDGNRQSADDARRNDHGDRAYPGRDFRDYESPYARQSAYENPQRSYDAGRQHNQGNYDQGRYLSSQYDAQYGQQRRTARGPKGYKRSDDRIREDVCDRLSNQYDVDPSEVEVTVSNGEVTLTGTVGDRDQKFRVEHLADGVGGVTEVHNQLRVKREAGAQASPQTSTNPQRNASNPTRHS